VAKSLRTRAVKILAASPALTKGRKAEVLKREDLTAQALIPEARTREVTLAIHQETAVLIPAIRDLTVAQATAGHLTAEAPVEIPAAILVDLTEGQAETRVDRTADLQGEIPAASQPKGQ
jgi:hypothetical protein